MNKRILYLGNKLSQKNRNISTVESLSKNLEELSFEVKSYSNQKNKILRLFSMLYAIFKHKHFDFVLIDTYSTSAFWFAWTSAKVAMLVNLKYITILHGGNLPDRLKKNETICKSLFSKAYINISPSNYLYEVFKDAGFTNLKLIPNSIEIKNYAFKKRGKIKPNILWVRAFADIYNPILALKVLKLLLKDFSQAKLSMVGPFKDNSIDECKAYAEKHQLPVEFTGKMAKTEWIDYAKNFDIFINTTNVDNTPVSVIEAMALGLPIVTTNVGGLPYLLKHQKEALLVNPNQVEEMYEAILNLLHNQDLAQQLSKNGRQLSETFDWEVVKHQWKDVLE
ncbi:glycosyltransferase family 4 protein [Flavobacterium sp. CS20]|jgi:glycosyltransferase involved in cell wall biosynthesis|uniref:glycosyltransferase family 4 protein n=1 Tax=Flavobacterium sp. CS20 TaxID=2775246 RepID=UPI001B3A4E05|nr:glycosyltransferase family 4 protein [Flavobacterium sp. CS20]QTY27247.1 glycosyltransferase family 4 protein [Flavobacterium sp. CS20]